MNYLKKRKNPRIECTKQISIKVIDSNGQIANKISGNILDISKGGVKIESPILINTGYIIISTPNLENKFFGIRGKVVYSAKNKTGGYLLGIKFEAPESSCIKFIRAVIRTQFFQINSNICKA